MLKIMIYNGFYYFKIIFFIIKIVLSIILLQNIFILEQKVNKLILSIL